jgi:hypothetical protein
MCDAKASNVLAEGLGGCGVWWRLLPASLAELFTGCCTARLLQGGFVRRTRRCSSRRPARYTQTFFLLTSAPCMLFVLAEQHSLLLTSCRPRLMQPFESSKQQQATPVMLRTNADWLQFVCVCIFQRDMTC